MVALLEVFTQHIIVKSGEEAPILTSATISDSTAATGNFQKIGLHVENRNHQAISGAKVSFQLAKDTSKIFRTVITNRAGNCQILISKDNVDSYSDLILAKIEYKNDKKDEYIFLPVKEHPRITFFPEGGYLVNNVPSKVGWEVTAIGDVPLQTSALLYANGKIIDTITTDRLGLGAFPILPINNTVYSVKLIGPFGDTSYQLPRALNNTPVLSIKNAVVNDTLNLKVSSATRQSITVLVHNYKQIFYATPVKITNNGRILNFVLKDVPRGLAEVTVLDSLQRPCAERLFFAHFNQRPVLTIETDKESYGKREKVTAKILLANKNAGMVSISCAESNRTRVDDAIDIESYYYLTNELDGLSSGNKQLGYDRQDIIDLEKLLLIKGWRRYNWQKTMSGSLNGSDTTSHRLHFSGAVTNWGKELKKPVKLIVIADSATRMFTTDPAGKFTLPNDFVISDDQKQIKLVLPEKNQKGLKISITNPFTSIHDKKDQRSRDNLRAGLQFLDTEIIKGLEHTHFLKEVTIKASKEPVITPLLRAGRSSQRNECGDYVCPYGILNCTNHVNGSLNSPPIVGQDYLTDGVMETYKGCATDNTLTPPGQVSVQFSALTYSRAFYGADYSLFSPPGFDATSTLFWKNLLSISPEKNPEVTFYTGDISGHFIIKVQGITPDGVIYAQKDLFVK